MFVSTVHVLIDHLHIFFCGVHVVSLFAFRSSLYIPDVSLLANTCPVNIFFYSMACLFIFLLLTIDEQKL